MNKARHPKKGAFLMAYGELGTVTSAAKVVGIGRTTHYAWIESDAKYRKAFEAARLTYVDKLEAELYRRAIEGVARPVFQGGKQVGEIREYSDLLLIVALRANNPEKYCDRRRIEHSAPSGTPIRVEGPGQEPLADPQLVKEASRVYLARLRQRTLSQP